MEMCVVLSHVANAVGLIAEVPMEARASVARYISRISLKQSVCFQGILVA